MKHAVFAGCLAVMMLLSLSLLLLRPVSPKEVSAPEEKPAVSQTVEVEKTMEAPIAPAYDESRTITMTDGDSVQTLLLSDYLTGVVLAEMPASFEVEALKAQAVAARTFCLRQAAAGKHADADVCGSGSCCQQYTSLDSVRQKLGESYEVYLQKVRRAVADTDGLVLRYNGVLIDAVYFSCSGGRTESAAAVWGGEVPYLQPVNSPGEEMSSRYADTVLVDEQQFRQKILEEAPSAHLDGSAAGWFGAVKRTNGGGVDSMEIGGVELSGTKLRSLFTLRSTNFTVSVTQQGIEFDTLGNGHRVGMSQYGAQAMAEAGSSFQEILKHYYSGIQIDLADP